MKVGMNNVGNYSPAYFKNATTRMENIRENQTNTISVEEKKFFVSLYPSQQEEVLGYNFYNSKGKVSGMHVGSLFDRRG
jgi:hypothetical protein